MSDLYIIDEERGAIRILITILSIGEPNSRMDLIKKVEFLGVGRSSFYSSLRKLQLHGFIEDKQIELSGRKVTYTALTPQGRAVAEKLLEIKELLDHPSDHEQH